MSAPRFNVNAPSSVARGTTQGSGRNLPLSTSSLATSVPIFGTSPGQIGGLHTSTFTITVPTIAAGTGLFGTQQTFSLSQFPQSFNIKSGAALILASLSLQPVGVWASVVVGLPVFRFAFAGGSGATFANPAPLQALPPGKYTSPQLNVELSIGSPGGTSSGQLTFVVTAMLASMGS